MDVIELLKDSVWDLITAHPPCTRLCNSGVLRLYKNGKKENGVDEKAWKEMEDGAAFFKKFLHLNCDKVAIENPIMHGYARAIVEVKYDQIIQLHFLFSHSYRGEALHYYKVLCMAGVR